MRKVLALGLLLLFMTMPGVALAKIGVGVGTGKIDISEKIKAGSIYTLPPITVFNTGDEAAVYTMAVTLNETQDQLKPKPQWFSFSPSQFNLEPGQSQVVTTTFRPPLVTQPGDYFAYLEAKPDQTVQQGNAVVGVAAATKLSFSVKSSNFFLALYHRVLALYREWKPWSLLAFVAILLAVGYKILTRYVKIQITRTKKDKIANT